jgi:hypothetical protein
MNNTELLHKVEQLKDILEARATGGYTDDAAYRALRQELLANVLVKSKLPPFIRECRTLSDFWGFIKPQFGQYAERREYLRQKFAPVLTFLEDGHVMPGDDAISATLSNVDSDHIKEAWRKALERRITDADGAITAARTLLESVCKFILDESSLTYDDKDDLPRLYSKAATQLNLAPNQHTEQSFRQILGGCQTIVNELAGLRNRLSDAHGKGKVAARPSPRHAELAVNLAGTMATFLITTWEVRKGS